MIKFAEVISRDLTKGTVKVKFPEDELESFDLPVSQMSSKGTKSLSLPDVGEQVVVAMRPDMVDGCVIGCLYNKTDTVGNAGNVDGFIYEGENGTTFHISKAGGMSIKATTGNAEMDMADSQLNMKAADDTLELKDGIRATTPNQIQMSSDTGISLTSNGGTLNLASDATMNAGGDITLQASGKVAVKNSAETLFAILNDLMTQLTLLTVVCAAPGSPSTPPINAAAIAAIQTRLALLMKP